MWPQGLKEEDESYRGNASIGPTSSNHLHLDFGLLWLGKPLWFVNPVLFICINKAILL